MRKGDSSKEARKTKRDANCANEHELGKGIEQKRTETEITAESPRRRAKRTLERSGERGEWSGGVMSHRWNGEEERKRLTANHANRDKWPRVDTDDGRNEQRTKGRLNLDRWRGKTSIARGNGCLNE